MSEARRDTQINSRQFAVPAANEFTQVTPFSILVLSILFVWILIDLFTRFIYNLSYNTLGLNSSSSIHTLLVLILVVVLLIATVWVIDEYELVEGGLVGRVAGLAEPILSPQEQEDQNLGPVEQQDAMMNQTFVSG